MGDIRDNMEMEEEEQHMINIQKVAVIGCGFVGSTIAYTLMQKGTFSEMVLAGCESAEGRRGGDGHQPRAALRARHGNIGRNV